MGISQAPTLRRTIQNRIDMHIKNITNNVHIKTARQHLNTNRTTTTTTTTTHARMHAPTLPPTHVFHRLIAMKNAID